MLSSITWYKCITEGHLGCFQCSAIRNRSTLNISAHNIYVNVSFHFLGISTVANLTTLINNINDQNFLIPFGISLTTYLLPIGSVILFTSLWTVAAAWGPVILELNSNLSVPVRPQCLSQPSLHLLPRILLPQAPLCVPSHWVGFFSWHIRDTSNSVCLSACFISSFHSRLY